MLVPPVAPPPHLNMPQTALTRGHLMLARPKGSKYPIFKVSGPKHLQGHGFLGSATFNIEYLDPAGRGTREMPDGGGHVP